MAPAAAVAVFEFVDDDVYNIRGDVLWIVGVDGAFPACKGKAFAVAGDVGIADNERGIGGEIGIARQQVRSVPAPRRDTLLPRSSCLWEFEK